MARNILYCQSFHKLFYGGTNLISKKKHNFFMVYVQEIRKKFKEMNFVRIESKVIGLHEGMFK